MMGLVFGFNETYIGINRQLTASLKPEYSMSKLIPAALAHLKTNWHIGMTGTSDTTELIGINPNTLKTRLTRHQALTLRNADGSSKGALMFTGYHLVYNMIADRMLRYGISIDADGTDSENPNKQGWLAHVYSQWAHDEILSGNCPNAILRCWKQSDGRTMIHIFASGDVVEFTGDAALIIPIGSMVTRLAASLFARFGGEAFHESIKA